MPKVFIVNRSYHDYSATAEFGEAVFLTEGSLPSSTAVNELYRRMLENGLSEATEDDYLVMSSLPILFGLAMGHFGSVFGKVNILVYRNNKYLLRTITLG